MKQKIPPDTAPAAYSVDDFAVAYGFCRATAYKLLRTGRGPAVLKIGTRTLITRESAEKWARDSSRAFSQGGS